MDHKRPENITEYDTRNKKFSLKRSKTCKRNHGLSHEFELIKPDWSYLNDTYRAATVDEYYRLQEAKIKSDNNNGTFGWLRKVFYQYKCTHCGKKDYQFKEPPMSNE